MKTVLALALTLMASVSLVSAADDLDEGAGGGQTVCERTAKNMFKSCRFEVNEEYFATMAKCINFIDEELRTECREDASATRLEDRDGCGDQRDGRKDVCELLDEDFYDPEILLDTNNFVAEPDDSNPYFSLKPGHTIVARAGEDYEETIVVTVSDEVREILGVNCRIVVDIVLIQEDDEYVAVEVTDDYYAQAINDDVIYCGEVARNFEDGALVDLDGSFVAGRDLAKSGVLIRAHPEAGDAHRQEYLPGEAEDVIRYVAGVFNLTSVGPDEGGENPAFPCDGECVKTEEFIPTEPGAGEFKYFKAGVGFVLGVALEDGKPDGERDEVLCTGDSLDILAHPDCGIDPDSLDELRGELCKLSPLAFCD